MVLLDLFRGSRKTTTILPSDVVVFIVGPSGSGKSRFMNVLLESANVHVLVSKGQKPGTTEVHTERCRFDGMRSDIVIVDTPSFCTNIDPDGEEVVRKWMESNYTGPCRWAGILYMHNLAFNPDDANLRISKHPGAFRRTCRQNLVPSNILVVPTLSYGARRSDERLRALTSQLQRQADAERVRLHDAFDRKPFDRKPETVWDIVQGLLSPQHFDGGGSAGSSVTVPSSRSSSGLSRRSEKAMYVSPKHQANDGNAQPGSYTALPLGV